MKNKTKQKKASPPTVVDAVQSAEPSTLSGAVFRSTARISPKGTGAEYAGQSGDLQGLSRKETIDSESVEGLAAEGQYHEAEIINAIEQADDPDRREVQTHK